MNAVAIEHIVDAAGCSPWALADLDGLRGLCKRIVSEVGVVVVSEPVWHRFPDTSAGPGGVTGLYLLSESHLAVHSWPERGALAINLCCCRAGVAFPWAPVLREWVGARDVVVRVLERVPDSPVERVVERGP